MLRKINVKKQLTVGILSIILIGSISSATQLSNNNNFSTNDELTSIPLTIGNTLYVGGSGEDNYSKIQDAINNANNSDTVFVYDDSSPYYENIDIIDKSISLIGEDKKTTIIDGRGLDTVINAITCSYLNISSFTIRKSGHKYKKNTGVIMESCNNCNISDNIIIDNRMGGVLLISSNDNKIVNNRVENNGDNIILGESMRNTIAYNNIFIGYGGISIHSSPENKIHHNNIHNTYMYNSGFVISNSSNCDIYMNNIEKNHVGISVDKSSPIDFNYNNIKNNIIGIWIDSGSVYGFYHNNFIGNILGFISDTCNHTFDNNYWNKPMNQPKQIIGFKRVMILPPGFLPESEGIFIRVPTIMYDYNPAQEPFDIPDTSNIPEYNIDELSRTTDFPFLQRFPLLNLLLQRLSFSL